MNQIQPLRSFSVFYILTLFIVGCSMFAPPGAELIDKVYSPAPQLEFYTSERFNPNFGPSESEIPVNKRDFNYIGIENNLSDGYKQYTFDLNYSTNINNQKSIGFIVSRGVIKIDSIEIEYYDESLNQNVWKPLFERNTADDYFFLPFTVGQNTPPYGTGGSSRPGDPGKFNEKLIAKDNNALGFGSTELSEHYGETVYGNQWAYVLLKNFNNSNGLNIPFQYKKIRFTMALGSEKDLEKYEYKDEPNNIVIYDTESRTWVPTEPQVKNGRYEIYTVGQMVWLSQNPQSIAYDCSLMRDIRFYDYHFNTTPTFTPIGNEANPFRKNFYGNGYVLRDLKIEHSGPTGLFGVTSNAHISRLAIENSTFYTYGGGFPTPMGSFIGKMIGGSLSECLTRYGNFSSSSSSTPLGGLVGEAGTPTSFATIVNSYVSMNTIGHSIGSVYVGGIVGILSNGLVSNCINGAHTVGHLGADTGGICGNLVQGSLKYSYALSMTIDGGTIRHGIVANTNGGTTIVGCEANLSLSSSFIPYNSLLDAATFDMTKLKIQTSFPTFGFGTTWRMDSANGPVLNRFPPSLSQDPVSWQ